MTQPTEGPGWMEKFFVAVLAVIVLGLSLAIGFFAENGEEDSTTSKHPDSATFISER